MNSQKLAKIPEDLPENLPENLPEDLPEDLQEDLPEDLPHVSILTVTRNRKAFLPLMLHNWDNFNYPKDKLEWIILDDGTEDLSEDLKQYLSNELVCECHKHGECYAPVVLNGECRNCLGKPLSNIGQNINYVKLERNEIKNFIDMIDLSYLSVDQDKKILNKKALGGTETDDKAELIQQYYKKTCRLPMGFKRDYGVNLCSHDFIMHMDDDDFYPPNSIRKRLSLLDERRRIQCIYTGDIDTYNVRDKKYQRVGLPKHCNEATLFHTKEYWNKYKFKWEDIYNEGKYFTHGHMEARRKAPKDMIVQIEHGDNYSMRNFKPVEYDDDDNNDANKLTAFNWNDIKGLIGKTSPEISLLDLFDKKREGSILSINSDSDILNNLKNKYDWKNLQFNPAKKFREKELLKELRGKVDQKKKHFDLMIMACKQPIWHIFKKYIFSVILLENKYNLDQVDGILTQNGYMAITLGKMCCYVAKMYLKTEQVKKKEGPPSIA